MLRYALGVACMIPILMVLRPRWPATRAEWGHVMVAGLLMHAGCHLSGSHYSQYLGLSAGITALVMALQPLATALIAARWMGEPLVRRQWLGVALGLAGVGLVVWHKMDVRELPVGSLVALCFGLAGVTAGTLYQKVFCPPSTSRPAASSSSRSAPSPWHRSRCCSRARASNGAGTCSPRWPTW